MRTAPDDLTVESLVDAVERGWGIDLDAVRYQPVGFGSHHWLGEDGSTRWWITVDDLGTTDGSYDEAFVDLRAAMQTVRDLGDAGCGFAVAPVRSTDGSPIERVAARYAVAVNPFIDGRAHAWGEVLDPNQLGAVVDVLAELHQVPVASTPAARLDEGGFDHRIELEALGARRAPADLGDGGPYAAPAARLFDEHRGEVLDGLQRYDALIADAGRRPVRLVLTHGEPHPGNLFEVDGRWVLIDWDTTRLAPPERDLWMLAAPEVYPEPPGDAGAPAGRERSDVLERHERAVGLPVDRGLIEAYRIRWQLAEVAGYLHHFSSPHPGSLDDDEAWTNLGVAFERLRSIVPATRASSTGERISPDAR